MSTEPGQQAESPPAGSWIRRLSLSSQIFIGLGAGIFLGVVLGELVGWLDVVGNIYIRLLQMTVLPYVTVALIAGLGSLTWSRAGSVLRYCGIFLLLTWVVAFVLILLTPLAFPDREAAAFFSSAMIEARPDIDLIQLYIPDNPFYSMANNLVPAVVLFSICLGAALIFTKNKDRLVDSLKVLTDALGIVTRAVVKLTPLGVFALSASAAGTLSIDELRELQVYLINFVLMCLVAGLWILPGLAALLTGIRYRTIMGASKDVLVTAFATGNVFVVLPMLADCAKQVFDEGEDTEAIVDLVVPLAYNFPNAGKLLMLIFVSFAGWFTGAELSVSDYPQFASSGLVTSFASMNAAIPFSLDLFHIPADMFELFAVTGIVNYRFSTLVAAVSIIFLSITTIAAVRGTLRIEVAKLVRFSVISLLVVAASIGLSRAYTAAFATTEYTKDQVIAKMHGMTPRVEFVVRRGDESTRCDAPPPGERLSWIRERQLLRVGYLPAALPFAFFNGKDELVGFDVEMAHILASELGLELEFVPTSYPSLDEDLNRGCIDYAMGGVISNTQLLATVLLTDPYLEITLGFVVPDHLRNTFSSWAEIRSLDDFRLAVVGSPYVARKASMVLPNADVEVIASAQSFFQDRSEEFDAVLMPVEVGSAWTLLHPEYSAVAPKPVQFRAPMVYAVPSGEWSLAEFLSGWVRNKEYSGEQRRLHDYWILGKNAAPKKPRWSVVRDVFGWVD